MQVFSKLLPRFKEFCHDDRVLSRALIVVFAQSCAGKAVVPVCTNDAQPGNFLARFAELCPGADVKPGFQVQRVRRLSDEEIEKAVAAAVEPQ